MKLYELVNKYHINTNLSCAEAMFKACNEYYHFNLTEDTWKMFSIMGSGMQTNKSCCGAFTVAVGMIGLVTAQAGQTNCYNMQGYEMVCELTDYFTDSFETLHCIELKQLEIFGFDSPCIVFVQEIAKKLEDMLSKIKLNYSQADSVLLN